jgi:hypothetical protein
MARAGCHRWIRPRRKIHKAVTAGEVIFRFPKAKCFETRQVPSAMVSQASLQHPIAKPLDHK